MGQIGEIFGYGLQARIELERGARTVVELLRERMDGGDGTAIRRKSLTERLGLKAMACCGPTWGLGPATVSVRDDDDDVDQEIEIPVLGSQFEVINLSQRLIMDRPITPCVSQSPAAAAGMNLAAALAAERQLRAVLDSDVGGPNQSPSPSTSPTRSSSNDEGGPTAGTAPGTPARVSLMRLLEETDGYDGEKTKGVDEGGCDSVCCVCMGRKKGAAFIPCGHTFCRVCSRELWLNRGSCPLCNRSILEILDIY